MSYVYGYQSLSQIDTIFKFNWRNLSHGSSYSEDLSIGNTWFCLSCIVNCYLKGPYMSWIFTVNFAIHLNRRCIFLFNDALLNVCVCAPAREIEKEIFTQYFYIWFIRTCVYTTKIFILVTYVCHNMQFWHILSVIAVFIHQSSVMNTLDMSLEHSS